MARHKRRKQHALSRKTDYRLLIVFVLVVEVKRYYRVLFTESPPPTETRETVKHKVRVAFSPQLFHEVEDRVQRLFRPTIVRTDADVAAEFEHGRFLARVQTRFLQDHHSLRLSQDVVVQCAFRYSVFRGRLGEAHLLSNHSLDRFLEIVPRPRGRLQLQQGGIVS